MIVSKPMMYTKHLHSLLLSLMLMAAPVAQADYPATQPLLDTRETIVNEAIRYPQGPAKVSAAIIELAPGASTGWHGHGVPLFTYLLAGELEIEYANGKRVSVKAGDAFMESMSMAHIGSNTGDKPVRILAVFMEATGTTKTLPMPAPGTPPVLPVASRDPDLVDLAVFDPRLKRDIRYATTNNFMGKLLYPAARAWLQRPAAEALKRAHDRLREQGYGIVVLDAYRPWQVTRAMWDNHPLDRAYLADPLQGSRHNRGAAVDVTLFDLATGQEVSMPSGFDDFSERAHPDYAGGTATQRAARDLLRKAMESEGFRVYPNEWWHFDFKDWQAWPLLNRPLSGTD